MTTTVATTVPGWGPDRARAVLTQARAAAAQRVACGFPGCSSPALADESWCGAHVPDEVAIARAASGDLSVRLMPHERVAAVRLLAGKGLSDRTVGARLGLCDRSILRIRHRHGIPPGVPALAPRVAREGVAS